MTDTKNEIILNYSKQFRKKTSIIFLGLFIMFTLGIYFLAVGSKDTSFMEVIGLMTKYFSYGENQLSVNEKIILYLRMPRIVMAIISGVGLSIAGVAMQGITRNSLVSPFTTGISSAAAFGASLTIVLGIGIFPNTKIGVILNAFIWSLICIIFILMLSSKLKMSSASIILIGTAFNYLFSSFTSIIHFFASENKLAAAIQWAFGSLNGINWNDVGVSLVFVTVSFIIIYKYSVPLNVISTGNDEFVKSLGYNPIRIRRILTIMSVVVTAAIISFVGIIGFVGLVAPHIARLILGNDHRFLIPFSGIVGGTLILVSDTLGRVIISPILIPVGIIISVVGVPLFINLVMVNRRVF